MRKVDKCLGAEIFRKKYDGFDLSLTKYDPYQEISFHYHKYPYYSLAVSGGYNEKNDINSIPVLSGTLIKRPSEYLHQNSFFNKDSYCFNIEFTQSEYLYQPINCDTVSCNNTALNVWRLFNHFAQNDDVLQIEAVLSEIMAEEAGLNTIPKKQSHVNKWLNKIEEYLQANIDEEVTLKDLSALVNVSPIYMIRAFKNKYGISIGYYRLQLRIAAALKHITNTNDTFVDIAYQLGFYDSSHFSKSFIKITGNTPAQFKRSIKKFI